MGVRSRSPPRPCSPCGVGRVPPCSEAGLVCRALQCVLVEVCHQYQGPGVPLHHVLEPVQALFSGLSGVAYTTPTRARSFSWYLIVRTNTSPVTASGSAVN